MKLFEKFRGGSSARNVSWKLYCQIVEQARRPEFYRSLGVPDTPTGRFDLLALHGILVLHRLRDVPECADLRQAFSDTIFADLDRNIREMGVGDLSVGKHMKKLASHFFGRIGAYNASFDNCDGMLQEALRRNLYANSTPSSLEIGLMVSYIRSAVNTLKRQPPISFRRGLVDFGLVPSN